MAKISDINRAGFKDRMNEYFLCLGGNTGDRSAHLEAALSALSRKGTVSARSAVYETEAWGMEGASFLNQAVKFDTALSPGSLIAFIHAIERETGRTRTQGGYADRAMDIDILLAGDRVIDSPGLQVPHPRMAERRFVLVPLNDIAPDVTHPISGKKVSELLAACRDPLSVRLFAGRSRSDKA